MSDQAMTLVVPKKEAGMSKVSADMSIGGADEENGEISSYYSPPAPAISAKGFCLQRLTKKTLTAGGHGEHKHEKAEIGIVFEPAEGALHCRTEAGGIQSFPLVGPTVYFVPPNILHQVEWSKVAENFCAHVEGCFWDGLDFAVDVAKFAVGPVAAAKRDFFLWQFGGLFRLMWNDRSDETSLVTLAEGMLKKATRVLGGAVSEVVAIVGGLTPSQHDKIDTYIEGKIDANLQTPVLARVVGLSVPQFINSLKVTTGLTPKDYVKRFRMLKAHQLLATGDYRLGEVASAVGYRDADHFSRLFKAFFNFCPQTLMLSARVQH